MPGAAELLKSAITPLLNIIRKLCPHRGAASIHWRHSLRVRRAPWAPGAPVLHLRAARCSSTSSHFAISKLSPSVERMGGEKRGGREKKIKVQCDAEVLRMGESKVKWDREAFRASASPPPLDTLCAVRYRSSGAPGRRRAASSQPQAGPEVCGCYLQNKFTWSRKLLSWARPAVDKFISYFLFATQTS